MKLSGEFIPNGDFKSTKKLTWLAKVTTNMSFVLTCCRAWVSVWGGVWCGRHGVE